MKIGLPYIRDMLIQVDNSTNTDPVCVEVDINKARVAEICDYINSKIGERNLTSQDDFQLER